MKNKDKWVVELGFILIGLLVYFIEKSSASAFIVYFLGWIAYALNKDW